MKNLILISKNKIENTKYSQYREIVEADVS